MKWFLILCVLFGGLYTTQVQSTPPKNVEVVFSGREDVTIEWEQVNESNYVCISKDTVGSEYVVYVQIDCFPSYKGWHLFSTKPYVDGMHKHRNGDVYFIEEFDLDEDPYKSGDGVGGKFGPYEPIHQYHLPIFGR